MNLLLVCNAGMSTGIMKIKLEEAAKVKQLKLTVTAAPLIELTEYLTGVDCILLSPQVRFALDEVIKKAFAIPVLVISPLDFGTMNSMEILNKVQAAVDNK